MTARAEPSTVIREVRVFDGTGVSDITCVLIDGGRISAVDRDLDGAGARVVDGAGGTLLPGFIDAHVHLHGADNLEATRPGRGHHRFGHGVLAARARRRTAQPPWGHRYPQRRNSRDGARFDPQQDAGPA